MTGFTWESGETPHKSFCVDELCLIGLLLSIKSISTLFKLAACQI